MPSTRCCLLSFSLFVFLLCTFTFWLSGERREGGKEGRRDGGRARSVYLYHPITPTPPLLLHRPILIKRLDKGRVSVKVRLAPSSPPSSLPSFTTTTTAAATAAVTVVGVCRRGGGREAEGSSNREEDGEEGEVDHHAPDEHGADGGGGEGGREGGRGIGGGGGGIVGRAVALLQNLDEHD